MTAVSSIRSQSISRFCLASVFLVVASLFSATVNAQSLQGPTGVPSTWLPGGCKITGSTTGGELWQVEYPGLTDKNNKICCGSSEGPVIDRSEGTTVLKCGKAQYVAGECPGSKPVLPGWIARVIGGSANQWCSWTGAAGFFTMQICCPSGQKAQCPTGPTFEQPLCVIENDYQTTL